MQKHLFFVIKIKHDTDISCQIHSLLFHVCVHLRWNAALTNCVISLAPSVSHLINFCCECLLSPAPEPHERELVTLLHHHPLAVVRQCLHHPLPKQDGHPGGKDQDVRPKNLLRRVWRYGNKYLCTNNSVNQPQPALPLKKKYYGMRISGWLGNRIDNAVGTGFSSQQMV